MPKLTEKTIASLAVPEGKREAWLTDYAMPGMTGAKLAKAARAVRPDLPVLVITGYAAEMAEDLERVADAVLRKPFGMEDLDVRIRAAIRASVLPRHGY